MCTVCDNKCKLSSYPIFSFLSSPERKWDQLNWSLHSWLFVLPRWYVELVVHYFVRHQPTNVTLYLQNVNYKRNAVTLSFTAMHIWHFQLVLKEFYEPSSWRVFSVHKGTKLQFSRNSNKIVSIYACWFLSEWMHSHVEEYICMAVCYATNMQYTQFKGHSAIS